MIKELAIPYSPSRPRTHTDSLIEVYLGGPMMKTLSNSPDPPPHRYEETDSFLTHDRTPLSFPAATGRKRSRDLTPTGAADAMVSIRVISYHVARDPASFASRVVSPRARSLRSQALVFLLFLPSGGEGLSTVSADFYFLFVILAIFAHSLLPLDCGLSFFPVGFPFTLRHHDASSRACRPLTTLTRGASPL